MYFPESEVIVREHSDLRGVVEQIDLQLATMFSSAPLRISDLACVIGCDANQVEAVFELLAGRGVVRSEKMVECRHCQNLMSDADFRQAIEDEDGFNCSSCSRAFSTRAQPIIVYRMTPACLAKGKPDVKGTDVSAAFAVLAHADCVFQCWGQKWVVKFQGEIRIMDGVRGMFYIARLLAEPKRDVPAVSLLAAAAGIDPRVASGTSGPLLTAETQQEYKKKYLEAQEEVEEAERNNDVGRIELAKQQREALGIELARATGLSGRTRQKTDAEKVRKSVSMAVSRAIEGIGKEHESLGRHLTASISSGIVFQYTPEQEGIVWLT